MRLEEFKEEGEIYISTTVGDRVGGSSSKVKIELFSNWKTI